MLYSPRIGFPLASNLQKIFSAGMTGDNTTLTRDVRLKVLYVGAAGGYTPNIDVNWVGGGKVPLQKGVVKKPIADIIVASLLQSNNNNNTSSWFSIHFII